MQQYASFSDYRSAIRAAHARFVPSFPADVIKEFGPAVQPTKTPGRPPWILRWSILFGDSMYIRTSELFDPVGARANPLSGKRVQFSFHYGPTPKRTDSRGWPKMDPKSGGTVLRVDLAPPYNDHIHFAGEDHVPQSRVKGLVIVDLDVFRFIEAVFAHRKTSRTIDTCLGFKLEKAS
jgi:hypothetical protein